MTGSAGTAADKTGFPAIGFGGASIGNLYRAIDDETAHAALAAAVDAGLAYFDTAPHYGFGLSERRIGAYLKSRATGPRPSKPRPPKPRLSTKVGRRLDPVPRDAPTERHGFVSADPFDSVFDLSADAITSGFAQSCARLGVDEIDLLFLHDIGEVVHGANHDAIFAQAMAEAFPAMDALKAAGKARAIGIGVNEIDVCERVLEQRHIDVILLAGRYSLLENEHSLPFMDACARDGVRIVVGGPFNSGLLVADPAKKARYNYNDAPPWAIKRAQALHSVCAAYDVPLPAVALAFCSAHPAVLSVIPGSQSARQVREIAAWRDTAIPAALWDALKERGLIVRDAPTP